MIYKSLIACIFFFSINKIITNSAYNLKANVNNVVFSYKLLRAISLNSYIYIF